MANRDATIFSNLFENTEKICSQLEKKNDKNVKYLCGLFGICHKFLSDFKLSASKILLLPRLSNVPHRETNPLLK